MLCAGAALDAPPDWPTVYELPPPPPPPRFVYHTAKMSRPAITMTTMMIMASPTELSPPLLDDDDDDPEFGLLSPALTSQRVPLKPDLQPHVRVLWLSPKHVPPFRQYGSAPAPTSPPQLVQRMLLSKVNPSGHAEQRLFVGLFMSHVVSVPDAQFAPLHGTEHVVDDHPGRHAWHRGDDPVFLSHVRLTQLGWSGHRCEHDGP